jgi:hypothetical protein
MCWLNITVGVEVVNHWCRGITPFIHSFTSAIDISDWPNSGPGRITNGWPALEFWWREKLFLPGLEPRIVTITDWTILAPTTGNFPQHRLLCRVLHRGCVALKVKGLIREVINWKCCQLLLRNMLWFCVSSFKSNRFAPVRFHFTVFHSCLRGKCFCLPEMRHCSNRPGAYSRLRACAGLVLSSCHLSVEETMFSVWVHGSQPAVRLVVLCGQRPRVNCVCIVKITQ